MAVAYTEQRKQSLVSKFKAQDKLSISAFAKENKLNRNTFTNWLKNLKEYTEAPVAKDTKREPSTPFTANQLIGLQSLASKLLLDTNYQDHMDVLEQLNSFINLEIWVALKEYEL